MNTIRTYRTRTTIGDRVTTRLPSDSPLAGETGTVLCIDRGAYSVRFPAQDRTVWLLPSQFRRAWKLRTA